MGHLLLLLLLLVSSGRLAIIFGLQIGPKDYIFLAKDKRCTFRLICLERLDFGPFASVRQMLHNLDMDKGCLSALRHLNLGLVERARHNLLGVPLDYKAGELLRAKPFEFLHDLAEHEMLFAAFFTRQQCRDSTWHLWLLIFRHRLLGFWLSLCVI